MQKELDKIKELQEEIKKQQGIINNFKDEHNKIVQPHREFIYTEERKLKEICTTPNNNINTCTQAIREEENKIKEELQIFKPGDEWRSPGGNKIIVESTHLIKTEDSKNIYLRYHIKQDNARYTHSYTEAELLEEIKNMDWKAAIQNEFVLRRGAVFVHMVPIQKPAECDDAYRKNYYLAVTARGNAVILSIGNTIAKNILPNKNTGVGRKLRLCGDKMGRYKNLRIIPNKGDTFKRYERSVGSITIHRAVDKKREEDLVEILL